MKVLFAAVGAIVLVLATVATFRFAMYLRQPKPPIVPQASLTLAEHAAIGCWELRSSHWESAVQLPERVRFDTTVIAWSHETVAIRLVVEPARGIGEHGVIDWAPYQRPNQVYVAWGNGLGGVFAKLTIHGDSLEGTAFGWYDIGGPFIAGDILGVRGACPRDSVPLWRGRR